MNKKLVLVLVVFLIALTGCAKTHFGVQDKALIVPPEVDETQAAIDSAKKSPGAKYCPDKIANAEKLAKDAMNVYWACQTTKALEMLAQARNMANEAKGCQPPAQPAPPAPAPAPTPPPPAREPISFHSVYFDLNKADLKPAGKAELDRAAKIMMENPDVVLECQGNTCNLGSAKYNEVLGAKRAKTVCDYLMSKGVGSNRLKTVSFGLAKPKAPNTSEQGRSQNRRVDMVILK